jgi:hypothetical protein
MDQENQSKNGETAPASLLDNRCRELGHLLLADRAVFYVQILHQMLVFRRQHELEPLHEDLFESIRAPQETASAEPYPSEVFLQDIRQLQLWSLITCRIEKERLRGYRDTRRRKFRYRLEDEATAFLLWLEDRRRDDLQPDEADTRDILEELSGTLRETARLMNRPGGESAIDLDAARAIMYRLARMSALTYDASLSLGEFNVRLLGFVISRYDIVTARALINELDHFLKRFLGRIHALRQEIGPEIAKLRHSRYRARWQACVTQMETERRATPHLLRARQHQDFDGELDALGRFYAEGGTLEQLCTRVSASSLLVWRKLYAHLRELERRSHRLEDLQARVREMARYPSEDAHASVFIHALLAPARMIGDMHYWSEVEKADPPQPRWAKHRTHTQASDYLGAKESADGRPVRSLEDERLRRLRDWMQRARLAPETDTPVRTSTGVFAEQADFANLIDLARHGLLGQGARLHKLGYTLTPTPTPVEVQTAEQGLAFHELLVGKAVLAQMHGKDGQTNP